MATHRIAGVNYSLGGDGTIAFFDKSLTPYGGGWALGRPGGGGMLQVTVDNNLAPTIRGLIEADIEAGNGDKLVMLLLGPLQACALHVEGVLTADHLKGAVEGPEFVDIPGVVIEGYTLIVRVLGNVDYRVATADKDGNIL